MENPSGEILYQELPYHVLLTSNAKRSPLKTIWLVMLLSVIGLTIFGHRLTIDSSLLSINNGNLSLQLDPTVSLSNDNILSETAGSSWRDNLPLLLDSKLGSMVSRWPKMVSPITESNMTSQIVFNGLRLAFEVSNT